MKKTIILIFALFLIPFFVNATDDGNGKIHENFTSTNNMSYNSTQNMRMNFNQSTLEAFSPFVTYHTDFSRANATDDFGNNFAGAAQLKCLANYTTTYRGMQSLVCDGKRGRIDMLLTMNGGTSFPMCMDYQLYDTNQANTDLMGEFVVSGGGSDTMHSGPDTIYCANQYFIYVNSNNCIGTRSIGWHTFYSNRSNTYVDGAWINTAGWGAGFQNVPSMVFEAVDTTGNPINIGELTVGNCTATGWGYQNNSIRTGVYTQLNTVTQIKLTANYSLPPSSSNNLSFYVTANCKANPVVWEAIANGTNLTLANSGVDVCLNITPYIVNTNTTPVIYGGGSNGITLELTSVASVDTTPPGITYYNLTNENGCENWVTDKNNACTTSAVNPVVQFNTDENAWCAIAGSSSSSLLDKNYTDMGSSRNCTGSMAGEGNSLNHRCTLTPQDEMVYDTSYVFISCKDSSNNQNSTSTSGALKLSITGLEAAGRTSIGIGIQNALLSGYTNYTDLQIYARNLSNAQVKGTFDRAAKKGSKMWAFNRIGVSDSHVNMFNLTPVLYTLEFANTTSARLTNLTELMINTTK